MEVSELVLWIARLLVLVLMYAFLLVLVFALVADARAAKPAGRGHAATPTKTAPAPAPAPTVSQLEVLDGTLPVTGRKYTLYGPLVIGRGTACEISIPNRFVSTRHARIFPHDGEWMLQDLGSTNGTLLNGEPLAEPCSLQPGDRVTVGDTEFEAK